MIKILIADDHPIVREGLKQLVAETKDLVVVDEAASGAEVLEKVGNQVYDVVLLDITMPGRSGLDIIKDLKNMKPKINILVLSIHPEEQYAVRVLKAGASGYLTKESIPDELLTAIRKIALGKKYISASFSERLAENLEYDMEKPLHMFLSDREYEVMMLIASGKTVTKIANELSLSVKTISTYRTRILEKMQMKTNAELTHYAIKYGLVE